MHEYVVRATYNEIARLKQYRTAWSVAAWNLRSHGRLADLFVAHPPRLIALASHLGPHRGLRGLCALTGERQWLFRLWSYPDAGLLKALMLVLAEDPCHSAAGGIKYRDGP